jgi:hypothetical protein
LVDSYTLTDKFAGKLNYMLLGNLFAWLILIPFILAFVVGFMTYKEDKTKT